MNFEFCVVFQLDSPEYFNTSVNVAQMLLLHEVLYNFSKSEIRSNTTIQDFLEFEQILLLVSVLYNLLSSYIATLKLNFLILRLKLRLHKRKPTNFSLSVAM